MKTAKKLAIDQLETGMVLAQDVCDAGGSRLLAQGSAISDATISSLRRRGVASVLIAFEETLSAEEMAARTAEIHSQVDHLFRQAGNDPMLLKLRATLLQYRLSGLE